APNCLLFYHNPAISYIFLSEYSALFSTPPDSGGFWSRPPGQIPPGRAAPGSPGWQPSCTRCSPLQETCSLRLLDTRRPSPGHARRGKGAARHSPAMLLSPQAGRLSVPPPRRPATAGRPHAPDPYPAGCRTACVSPPAAYIFASPGAAPAAGTVGCAGTRAG